MIVKIYKQKTPESPEIFRSGLNTEDATAFDYIKFTEGFVSILQEDRDALEKEANLGNRTLAHGFSGVSTIRKVFNK